MKGTHDRWLKIFVGKYLYQLNLKGLTVLFCYYSITELCTLDYKNGIFSFVIYLTFYFMIDFQIRLIYIKCNKNKWEKI